jgi:hypothetical protein
MNASATGIEITTKWIFRKCVIPIFPITINIDGQDSKGK